MYTVYVFKYLYSARELCFGMKTPKTNKKSRTPSGTVISQKAADIRGYFENEISNFEHVKKHPRARHLVCA